MKQGITVILAVIATFALTACERGSAPDRGNRSETFPVPAEADGKREVSMLADEPTSPTLGPISSADSFFPGAGGTLVGEAFHQFHFNIINAHLFADFEPQTISFVLQSDGVDGVIPEVDLAVFEPGGTAWTTLEENISILGEVTKTYELTNSASGKYAIRIFYNSTMPVSNVRPVLKVMSISLAE